MKIADAEAYICHFPLTDPFYPSWIPGLPLQNNSCIMLRLVTDEGIEGACAGMAFTQEWKGVPDLIKLFLIGRDPFQVEDFIKVLRGAKVIGFRPWFIEVAFWDIIGKAAGQPVYRLLGGSRDRVKAYASTGELRDPETRAQDALRLVEEGFTGIKLRIRNEDPRVDLAVVEAVRVAVGDDVEIMVDANQAWLIHGFAAYPRWDLKRAMYMAKELEELGVVWLEEPLRMNDYDGLSILRRSTSVAISGGELNDDLDDFREFLTRGCYDILQPDVTFAGGILTCRKIAGMAEAANVAYNPHTWTNGLGLAANLQLMGAIPNCTHCEFPYDPPGWVPEGRDAMLAQPIAIDGEGYVPVPSGPGLGVEVDWEKVRAHGEKIS
ncbi:MAG: mandelate racemase/muconate lactonizing enzyme family protein [Actinomycetota bacterium]|nr:mandelate racemase/muconate lactonizing enzyme family protein [Actinomycetota bacterium]MDD5667903.1 mandelate racemase/muconate lactonizing enzyme family protein [Actinomycetota bacterium]